MQPPPFYVALIQCTTHLYILLQMQSPLLITAFFIIWWVGCHLPFTDNSIDIFLSIKQYWANLQPTSAPFCVSAVVVTSYAPPGGCI